MRKIEGYVLILISLIFAFVETNQFGNNIFPQSKEEIICDIIALMIFISGVILIKRK